MFSYMLKVFFSFVIEMRKVAFCVIIFSKDGKVTKIYDSYVLSIEFEKIYSSKLESLYVF